MTNIIEFKRPEGPPPPEEPLFLIDLYPRSTLIRTPDGEMPDPDRVSEELFDATFHVLSDAQKCHVLIAINDTRCMTFRQSGSFDTAEQHAWLRRRLDDVYETCTGQRRHASILNRVFCVIRDAFRLKPKDSKNDPHS